MPARIVSGGWEHAAAFRARRPGWAARVDGCRGLRAARDLNFDTNGDGGPDAGDDWWNGGRGWDPIRGTILEAVGLICYCDGYRGTFEGNGHVIANLFVDRAGAKAAGLFGIAHDSSVIRRVGLPGVDVTGGRRPGAGGVRLRRDQRQLFTARVRGNATGGLIGVSRGDVTPATPRCASPADDEDARRTGRQKLLDAVVTASFAPAACPAPPTWGGLSG